MQNLHQVSYRLDIDFMKFGTDQEGKRLTQRWVSEVLLESKSPKE